MTRVRRSGSPRVCVCRLIVYASRPDATSEDVLPCVRSGASGVRVRLMILRRSGTNGHLFTLQFFPSRSVAHRIRLPSCGALAHARWQPRAFSLAACCCLPRPRRPAPPRRPRRPSLARDRATSPCTPTSSASRARPCERSSPLCEVRLWGAARVGVLRKRGGDVTHIRPPVAAR